MKKLKYSLHKTGKQRKRLFEVDIKTKLCNTRSIWQRFGSNSRN